MILYVTHCFFFYFSIFHINLQYVFFYEYPFNKYADKSNEKLKINFRIQEVCKILERSVDNHVNKNKLDVLLRPA